MMLHIESVEYHPSNKVQGWVDLPHIPYQSNELDVNVVGWVIADNLDHIILFDGALVVAQLTEFLDRPDVREVYSWIPNLPLNMGFSFYLSIFKFPAQFEMQVVCVLKTGEWVPLATLRGTRGNLDYDSDMALKPIYINSRGRSGTTLLMQSLSLHPQITVAGDYPYEVLQTMYWFNVFNLLTATQARFNYALHKDGHYVSYEDVPRIRPIFRAWNILVDEYEKAGHDTGEFLSWQNEQHRGAVWQFCLQRLANYYEEVARVQHKPNVQYFAEKAFSYKASHNKFNPHLIILLRDPRDVLASVHAFNKKRGFVSFQRDNFPDDKTYSLALIELYRRYIRQYDDYRATSHLVRYEDLIRSPISTYKHLFDFLALDSSPAQLQDIQSTVFQNSPSFERHRTTDSADESVGRWKKELSPELIELFRDTAGDVLQRLGYDD